MCHPDTLPAAAQPDDANRSARPGELNDLVEHYAAGTRLLHEASSMLNSIQAALALAELQAQPVDMTLLNACSGLHHVLSQVRTHYKDLFELAQPHKANPPDA